MSTTSVRSVTASSGKTALAFVAIFSLLLSLFAIARPVLATDDTVVPLHNTTADVKTDCEETVEGQMLFHFVLNQIDDGTTVNAFSAEFDTDGDGVADVTYTLADSNVTVEEKSSSNYHINVLVDGEHTLIDASVTLSSQDDPAKPNLVLSHICDETTEDVDGSLTILKTDDNLQTPTPLSATFQVTGPDNYDETFVTDATTGWVCIDGLAPGLYTITETIPPAGYDPAADPSQDFDVVVDDGCESDDGAVDVTFRNALTEEEEGLVEIDKLFCFTDEEASTEFFVFGPLVPEELRTLGQEEELPEEGCWTEAVAFTITGGDLTEPMHVMTGDDGILEFNLPASEIAYVITEDVSGESAEFFVEDGEFTAIVVLNLVPEEETGVVKVIKLFCEGDEAGVEFIVEGADAPVPVISGCEVGDASFLLGDLEITTENGIAVHIVGVGDYSFEETDPNAAEYEGTIVVEVGEITTIIVINTFEEGEEPGTGGPGQNETPREGTQGGNPLPNTATSPFPTGSAPAALLALLMLAGLGAASYAVRAEARRRR